MVDLLLKGIGIGFAVAAPVGPIGILCIKRTLNDGRASGLAAGLGAASADACYGVMVAAGFAATGLLVSYARPMELFGGALITVLGVLSMWAFMRSARGEVQPTTVPSRGGLFSAFATTFVLTITNPMTILAFVALVAGLGASAAAHPFAPYIIVIGVFAGSALWWLFLVTAAWRAGNFLTHKSMRFLDLFSGLVLAVWGLWIFIGALQ